MTRDSDRMMMLTKPISSLIAGFAILLTLGACAGDDEIVYVERPAEDIYNTAANALDAGRYQQAAQEFDEVERQHPYSEWATRAQLLAGYAYYQD
ncbi:MAG: outer membrane protein assembly factor BamD [Pseudomonadota bacterium]